MPGDPGRGTGHVPLVPRLLHLPRPRQALPGGDPVSHDYHEGQPGFSPAQVLHDGCGECEQRGADVSSAIAHLDSQNFAAAWGRAFDWNTRGLADVAVAEVPLLRALWSLQLQFERRGVPIGEMPAGGSLR